MRKFFAFVVLLSSLFVATHLDAVATYAERTRTQFLSRTNGVGLVSQGPLKVNGYLDASAGGFQMPVCTAPVNAVAATRTLTFTGVTADTQTVTIGTRVYEFDSDSSVTAGRIAVDISGGATASASVTALVTAITGDADAVVTAADGTGDTVDVTAKTKGTAANSYATTETLTNGSWAGATLTGGVDSTVAPAGAVCQDATYIYASNSASTVSTQNWRRIAKGSAY